MGSGKHTRGVVEHDEQRLLLESLLSSVPLTPVLVSCPLHPTHSGIIFTVEVNEFANVNGEEVMRTLPQENRSNSA